MKRIFALMLCLIIACLALTGCGNQDNAENDAGKNGTTSTGQAAQLPDGVQVKKVDGMYEWNVRGVTLRTKSNVADYIHGKIWDFKAFLKTLGWIDSREEELTSHRERIPSNTYCYNDLNQAYMSLGNSSVSFIADPITIPTEGKGSSKWYTFYGIDYRYGNKKDLYWLQMEDIYFKHEPCEYYVDYEPYQMTIPFELIVSFHYICEHLAENSDINPLDALPLKPNSNGLIYDI